MRLQPVAGWRAWGFACGVLCLLGCTERAPTRPPPREPATATAEPAGRVQPVEPPARAVDPPQYDTPLRSDGELAQQLVSTCARAAEQHRPWLVELSAAWCGDCRALHALEQQSPLREELARWPHVVVNVGDFDRHADLRKRLGVRAIAHWAVLEPSSCETALLDAPVILQRTLEPRSGMPVTAAELTDWLGEARALWEP